MTAVAFIPLTIKPMIFVGSLFVGPYNPVVSGLGSHEHRPWVLEDNSDGPSNAVPQKLHIGYPDQKATQILVPYS